ncbi:hypothetical protein N310_05388, partial [Acanthisitta chloris]
NCDLNVDFWAPPIVIAASLFMPGASAVKAHALLSKLGCWLAKQTNAMSLALSGLLSDVQLVQHATLQNRAAIDFLLLAHGHGCEDFDGMCCMNLSDHSESIHDSIQKLRENVDRLRLDNSGDWLDALLHGWGLTGWLMSLVKWGLILLGVLLAALLGFACLY